MYLLFMLIHYKKEHRIKNGEENAKNTLNDIMNSVKAFNKISAYLKNILSSFHNLQS